MKKQYIQPSTNEVKIQATMLMAGSLNVGGTTDQNLSRSVRSENFWDDDED